MPLRDLPQRPGEGPVVDLRVVGGERDGGETGGQERFEVEGLV